MGKNDFLKKFGILKVSRINIIELNNACIKLSLIHNILGKSAINVTNKSQKKSREYFHISDSLHNLKRDAYIQPPSVERRVDIIL
ncbi:MAG: hypothetical protein QG635_2345 [Bacteroidota bacterium]|nr:hypothetical protein [Bacteroidota bacterium]